MSIQERIYFLTGIDKNRRYVKELSMSNTAILETLNMNKKKSKGSVILQLEQQPQKHRKKKSSGIIL